MGPHPEKEEARLLKADGITHVLNVGNGDPRNYKEVFDFSTWIQIEDLVPIPEELLQEALTVMHSYVTANSSQVLIHCIAGQNRSPTITWAYLVACGMDPYAAGTMIAAASYDAVPGHPKLIHKNRIPSLVEFGKVFLPHPRPEALADPDRGEVLL